MAEERGEEDGWFCELARWSLSTPCMFCGARDSGATDSSHNQLRLEKDVPYGGFGSADAVAHRRKRGGADFTRRLAQGGERNRQETRVLYGFNSLIGRTSMLPSRAGGIFEATWIASFKSLASIR